MTPLQNRLHGFSSHLQGLWHKQSTSSQKTPPCFPKPTRCSLDSSLQQRTLNFKTLRFTSSRLRAQSKSSYSPQTPFRTATSSGILPTLQKVAMSTTLALCGSKTQHVANLSSFYMTSSWQAPLLQTWSPTTALRTRSWFTQETSQKQGTTQLLITLLQLKSKSSTWQTILTLKISYLNTLHLLQWRSKTRVMIHQR